MDDAHDRDTLRKHLVDHSMSSEQELSNRGIADLGNDAAPL
jgi:hypothetical protein